MSKFINCNFNELSILFFLLSILPISILVGSASININVLLINITFIYILIIKKKLFFFKNVIFYHLIGIYIFFIFISLFFSIDIWSSIERSVGLLRFILLAFAIKYFFENSDKIDFLLKVWFVIFFLVNIDLIYEFTTGQNILGFKSRLDYRLASFTNDELKIGHYFFSFALISICFVKKYLGKKYILFILLTILIIGFLIGERSNFIKLFLSILIFYFFINKNVKKLFVLYSIILIILAGFITFNKSINDRYYTKIINPLIDIGLIELIKNNQYGSHYFTAYKIFKENIVFGTGIKTFRIKCSENKYYDTSLKFPELRCSTHPHQLHLELLSETGLIGYLLFLYVFLFSILYSLIKNKKNLISTAGLLIVSFSLLPLIPSGSFFTTYGATLFWINFGLMIQKSNKLN